MAQLLRRKSKVLVAFGSCASEGCIPGLGNLNDRKSIFDTVYNQGSATAPDNPQNIHPQHETQVPEGTLYLPVFYDTLKTLEQTVDVDYFLPGCPPGGRQHLEGDHGHRRRQAAAEGLDDRRRHDRLRRVQAEAERKEDQEVLPHLGDHSRRRDLPAGAGPDVLRHRHAGRLRGPVPGGQLALHRLPRPERRRGRLRLAADERRGLGHRLERRRGNRPHHRRRHSRSRRHVLSLQPGRQPAAAECSKADGGQRTSSSGTVRSTDHCKLHRPRVSERDDHHETHIHRPRHAAGRPRQDRHLPRRAGRRGQRLLADSRAPRLREVLRRPPGGGHAEPHGPHLRRLPRGPPHGGHEGPGSRCSTSIRRRRPRSCASCSTASSTPPTTPRTSTPWAGRTSSSVPTPPPPSGTSSAW